MAKNKKKKNAGAIVAKKQEQARNRIVAGKISREFTDGYYAGVDMGVNQTLLLACYALRKSEKYGRKRLQRFFDKVVSLSEAIQNDELTFEDMELALKKECRFPLPFDCKCEYVKVGEVNGVN